MRSRIVPVLGLALIAGCGGGGDSNPTVSTPPVAATPAPTPAPAPTPPALNVTGGWRSEARSWNFRLEQSGTTLRGVVVGFKNVTYPNLDDPLLQITGSITSGGAVAFKAPAFGIDFSGNVEPSGTRMTGTLFDCANGCRNYGEVLVKQ